MGGPAILAARHRRRRSTGTSYPLRKSARIRSLPPGSTPASTGSTPSPPPSRRRPTARKHATPYTPQRAPGIDLDTPRNRIRWGDSRPTAASLAKVSLSGTDSALSGASREMGIPIIHHADRKTKSEEVYILFLLPVTSAHDLLAQKNGDRSWRGTG